MLILPVLAFAITVVDSSFIGNRGGYAVFPVTQQTTTTNQINLRQRQLDVNVNVDNNDNSVIGLDLVTPEPSLEDTNVENNQDVIGSVPQVPTDTEETVEPPQSPNLPVDIPQPTTQRLPNPPQPTSRPVNPIPNNPQNVPKRPPNTHNVPNPNFTPVVPKYPPVVIPNNCPYCKYPFKPNPQPGTFYPTHPVFVPPHHHYHHQHHQWNPYHIVQYV